MARLSSSRIPIISLLAVLLLAGWVAGALAQAGGTRLVVVEVQSRVFPQVAALVAVADAQGPVEGLSANSFQINEDGTEVPAGSIEVEPARLTNLRVVLALDVSGAPADLAQTKEAAKAFIDTLGPQDRVAVMSFGDDVRLVRDFTNNNEELHTAIDSLSAIGSLTVLNRTLIEAVNLADQFEVGRKAVIIITNRLDNSRPPVPITESLTQAQAANIPIYVIGFSSDVPASPPLETQLASTTGQFLSLPNAQAVQQNLLNIGESVRRGYRVTFTSTLKADNAEHDFSIAVTRPDGEVAQAEGRFTATAGPVRVEVAGLSSGQTVSGSLNLTPRVTAPAPLASVEYLLDGESLSVASTTPYALEWDSATVEPGPHTLTIQATDSAGNTGQVEIDFSVIVPLQLSLSTPTSEVEVGDAVPLQANIQATSELVRVDFLLDGVVLDSKTAPPYAFNLDSSQYTVGAHEITLRVEDSSGYVGEDSLTLQFLPRPLPQPSWFERLTTNPRVRLAAIVVVALLTLLAIILIAVLLLRLIHRLRYRRSQKLCRLEILNLGNIASPYQLQARDSLGGLGFQFSWAGASLPLYVPPPPAVPGVTSTSRLATGPMAPVTAPAAVASTGSSPSAGSASGSRASQAVDKANAVQSQAYGCVYTIVDILESIAFLLPGPAAAPIRSISAWLSRGQSAVDQAVRTPTQMVRTADYVRDRVAENIPRRSGQAPAGSRPDTHPVEPVQTSPVAQTVRPASTAVQPVRGQSHGYSKNAAVWAQTPVIEPAGSLFVDLLIIPANPYQRQSYPFTLLSKAAEQENAPLVSEQGVLEVPGISWFWRYVPTFIIIGLALLLGGGVIWLAIWRLNEMNLLN